MAKADGRITAIIGHVIYLVLPSPDLSFARMNSGLSRRTGNNGVPVFLDGNKPMRGANRPT
jgi:hypothetical protein